MLRENHNNKKEPVCVNYTTRNRTIIKLVTEQLNNDLHASPDTLIGMKWKRINLA